MKEVATPKADVATPFIYEMPTQASPFDPQEFVFAYGVDVFAPEFCDGVRHVDVTGQEFNPPVASNIHVAGEREQPLTKGFLGDRQTRTPAFISYSGIWEHRVSGKLGLKGGWGVDRVTLWQHLYWPSPLKANQPPKAPSDSIDTGFHSIDERCPERSFHGLTPMAHVS